MKLTIKDLKKKYDKKEVLKGVNFTFESGKIYGLLGRNGTGKTTFFNCVNMDIKPDSGLITLDDVKINLDDIGYVVSTPVVPSFLTAREFLKFVVDIHQSEITVHKTIDEYFDIVGIEPIDRDKLLKDYSHGMKTKIQIIVNIILNTKVLLLDEPLTALDVVAAEEMKKILRNQKTDKVMIFSTHIMELALTLCDEIVLLKDGRFELLEICDEEGNKRSDEELREIIVSALKEGAEK